MLVDDTITTFVWHAQVVKKPNPIILTSNGKTKKKELVQNLKIMRVAQARVPQQSTKQYTDLRLTHLYFHGKMHYPYINLTRSCALNEFTSPH